MRRLFLEMIQLGSSGDLPGSFVVYMRDPGLDFLLFWDKAKFIIANKAVIGWKSYLQIV